MTDDERRDAPETGMRVLVVGAGRTGAQVLRQLEKNPALTVLTLDPHPDPFAVTEGLIEAVDLVESLTPLTLEYILERTRPDLVILTTTTQDLGLGAAPAMDILADALHNELAAVASVPVLQVVRSANR